MVSSSNIITEQNLLIIALREENTILKEENTILKNAVVSLTAKVEKLTTELKLLKDKYNLNSETSSLPPSSDLYKKINKDESIALKKRGAQLGHPAHHRKLLPPDNVVFCELGKKCHCGGTIKLLNKIRVIQKIELPEIKPLVTNYELEQGVCTCCEGRHTANLPTGITPDLLGPKAKALVGTLTGMFNISKPNTQLILKQIFGIEICLGMVPKTENRVSEKCKGYYENVLEELKNSSYIHIDETSLQNTEVKKKSWIWVIANAYASLFAIQKTRGKKVLADLLSGYDGNVITDRYAAYTFFSDAKRQACLAHIFRDFKRFEASSFDEISKVGKDLVKNLRSIFILKQEHVKNKISREFLLIQSQAFLYGIEENLKALSQMIKHKQASNVAKNILKRYDTLWLFLKIPSVSPTNNLAERCLRNSVIYRKTSFFVRSDKGERFIERIKTLLGTCKLRGENPFHILNGLLRPNDYSLA